eukprot:CAMPEP_0177660910 /NCGR_PEP_ID=MMETSP0447-20121125/18339_1 /TAXON_ID=0 /ORGANISM="Stygamoeba regulata, Strain BSH-02190019" /LENGTH=53 /DNA_ID=CAMNT_0019166101 /DNA_START=43 /DNA_END=201 /DNA_ORIENTATION=-
MSGGLRQRRGGRGAGGAAVKYRPQDDGALVVGPKVILAMSLSFIGAVLLLHVW